MSPSRHVSIIHAFLNTAPKTGAALVCLLLIASGFVYLPGVSGPFVFDDFGNLLVNSYVQMTKLSASALYHAAFSLQSGPLHRPIAMISFALNYFFTGSFDNPLPYKLTNIVIHLCNGLLVFWIVYLILKRLTAIRGDRVLYRGLAPESVLLAAAMIALLWIVHPIQITSVLYVVQRMASLAASFTLLGILCYLKGRQRIVENKSHGMLILLGLFGFGTLGILTKESAVLLPLFMLVLEFVLFPDELPWKHWHRLSARHRKIITLSVIVAAAVMLAGVVLYALPGYASRDFTMAERLLTEPRVLFFYLSLLLVPQTDRFAIYHDEIPLSTSFLTPWTTLPAIAGIIGLFAVAYVLRRRHPLLSLGILWFFAGHALESTVISLEITHEHRNYLASLGLWMVMAEIAIHAFHKMRVAWVWAAPLTLTIAFAGITFMRSQQWGDLYTLAAYETAHHPRSADTQNFYGVALGKQGRYAEAYEAFKRASELRPTAAHYRLNKYIAAIQVGIPVSNEEETRMLESMKDDIQSASVFVSLQNINNCIETGCRVLQPAILRWTDYLIRSLPPDINRAFFYFLKGNALAGQGRTKEALEALMCSYQEDKMYLHPLISATNIYIRLHDVNKAEEMLEMLRQANRGNLHPRDAEIAQLSENINKLKREHQTSS